MGPIQNHLGVFCHIRGGEPPPPLGSCLMAYASDIFVLPFLTLASVWQACGIADVINV